MSKISTRTSLYKRTLKAGIGSAIIPFLMLATADISTSLNLKPTPPLQSLFSITASAASPSYETLVTEWLAARKKLDETETINQTLDADNKKVQSGIATQKQSIQQVEKNLNNAAITLANAEGTLDTLEKDQNDPLGEDLNRKRLDNQSVLETALAKTDAAKHDIQSAETTFKRIKVTVDELEKAVAAADASAKASRVVARAVASAQLAIAKIELADTDNAQPSLMESGFVEEANAQALATEKSAGVARNALNITKQRLQRATDQLTANQEILAVTNKAVETAYANFAIADKSYKDHDAQQQVKIKQIQAEIKTANAKIENSQIELQQHKNTLNDELVALENFKIKLVAGQKMRATLDEDISGAKAAFSDLNIQLRRAQRARSERDAVILATLNADLHDRLRDGATGLQASPQIYNRFMVPTESLFRENASRFSTAGIANIESIEKLIDDIPNRIPKGVDWVLRIDAHADGGGTAWDLSQARALNIVKHIAANSSITADRLSANAYGRFKKLDTGENFQELAANGWIEIILAAR